MGWYELNLARLHKLKHSNPKVKINLTFVWSLQLQRFITDSSENWVYCFSLCIASFTDCSQVQLS